MELFIKLSRLAPLFFLPLLASAVAAATPGPATAPSKAYRMIAEVVDGTAYEWVLVIITPQGYAWVTTPDFLHTSIRRRIPHGATLEWVPQDTVRGGEPLRTERELGALHDLCRECGIDFVHIPAG